ncbi:MAG: hypothetical protein Q7S27_02045 [Nanoarchaeota archaeon]|nr:hypothetical protein [Nanoarchaeota archaeon]
MKKEVMIAFLLGIVLISGFALAQSNDTDDTSNLNDESDKIEKAYQCLADQIKGKDSLSLQDAIFGTLAVGNEKKLKDKIEQEKKGNENCWPKAGCTIKDTAQTLLALDRIGGDEKSAKDWLLTKMQPARDLTWYLEIDIQNHGASECKLTYDGRESKIKVREDMKLEGSPGSCFEISYGGYWLKIADKCLEKEFSVSCDQDFITALVYQKNSGSTVFVSSETHSSVSLGTTSEKVESKCFSTGNKCDYEGTLWASVVLAKIGEDVSSYIPYLLAFSGDNQRYLPSSFLYMLTNGDESYSELVDNQKLGQYWSVVASPYNRFYDTALAMLALGDSDSGELDSAKNYLLNVQTKEGCWNNNNIRDSAFILYSGWPKTRGDGAGTGGGTELCEPSGYYCEAESDCLEIGGSALREFECTIRSVCCTKKFVGVSCDEKRGLVCSSNQRCTGRIESSADGSCCIEGSCENIPTENLCALADGICKGSCSEDEENIGESCPDSGDLCCKEKVIPEEKGGILWIVILSVLIIIVILGIIFRHRIAIWWHSRKRRGGQGTVSGPRLPPGTPPGMVMPRPIPRYGPPTQRGPARGGPILRPTRGAKSPQDKEMEETMKKLREMSK